MFSALGPRYLPRWAHSSGAIDCRSAQRLPMFRAFWSISILEHRADCKLPNAPERSGCSRMLELAGTFSAPSRVVIAHERSSPLLPSHRSSMSSVVKQPIESTQVCAVDSIPVGLLENYCAALFWMLWNRCMSNTARECWKAGRSQIPVASSLLSLVTEHSLCKREVAGPIPAGG